MQLPDGTIQIINEDEKPDGFIEELNVESVQSEVPQSLIEECERLCKDGKTRFIFDKHLTNTARKRISHSKKETRDMLTAPTYKIRLVKEVRSGKRETHERQSVATTLITFTEKINIVTMKEQGEQESMVSDTTHITYNRFLSVTA